MSENSKQTTLEVMASSVDEAIEEGLSQLNLPREAIDVEILDPGNKGLFGLGARQARVRLSVIDVDTQVEVQEDEEKLTEDISQEYQEEEFSSEMDEDDEEIFDFEDEYEDLYEASSEDLTEDQERIVQIAKSTVSDLLERMKVNAHVEANYRLPEYEGERATLWIDITGNDLSILIGRRSQTLQALQYITSLILGKELERSVPLVIDVEGYRSRREAQLRRLANSMADQAVKSGRTQALEPMTAAERRIVHISLRNYPGVHTESIGEDPHRKVTIIPDE